MKDNVQRRIVNKAVPRLLKMRARLKEAVGGGPSSVSMTRKEVFNVMKSGTPEQRSSLAAQIGLDRLVDIIEEFNTPMGLQSDSEATENG